MNTYIQVLKKYAVFNGRAARKEYWMYGVINAVIYLTLSAVLGFIGGEKGSLHLIAVVYLLATACPDNQYGPDPLQTAITAN